MNKPTHLVSRAARVAVMCLLAVTAGVAVADGAQARKTAAKTPPAKKTAAKSTKPSSYSASTARARRARLARARAAARARDLAAAMVPRFKLDDHGDLVPDVRAEAAIVYNPATGQILWESGAFSQRSIASITKVMTALCFLDGEPDLAQRNRGGPSRPARRLDDVFAIERTDPSAGRPAPGACRVGQRGRAHPGPIVGRRARGVRGADEREGRGTGFDQHTLCRPVRP